MNARQERALMVCTERLRKLPAEVHTHPALMFNPWLEGYKDYAFGGRAGPNVSARNLFHELGHAVQFGAMNFRHRATADGYHFKVRHVFIGNQYCVEPRSGQATHRELETFAAQLHLMELAGMRVDGQTFADYSAYVMRLMHDWWHIPGKDEKQRERYCSRTLLAHYERLDKKDVVGGLVAWLDATQARLKRQRSQPVRAYHRAKTRYRVSLPALAD